MPARPAAWYDAKRGVAVRTNIPREENQLRQPPTATIVLCVISAGLAGGIVSRIWAMAMPMKYGGVPVTLSGFGEVFFFVLGVVAGAVAAIVIVKKWHRQVFGWGRSPLVIMTCTAAGCVAAPVAIIAVCWTFFTIPQEWFEMLTNPPAKP